MALLTRKEPRAHTHATAPELNEHLVSRLTKLSGSGFCGSVEVVDRDSGSSAIIYLWDGGVYAVRLDGYEPDVATRLGVAGRLSDDTIARVHERATGPDFGVAAVDDELLTVPALAAVHQEFLLAAVGQVLTRPHAKIHTHAGQFTAAYCTLPLAVQDLLDITHMRLERSVGTWEALGTSIAPGRLVLRVPERHEPVRTAMAEARAIAEAANGVRPLDEIAHALALTRAEALHIAALLVSQGVLSIDSRAGEPSASDALLVPEAFGEPSTLVHEVAEATTGEESIVVEAIETHEPATETHTRIDVLVQRIELARGLVQAAEAAEQRADHRRERAAARLVDAESALADLLADEHAEREYAERLLAQREADEAHDREHAARVLAREQQRREAEAAREQVRLDAERSEREAAQARERARVEAEAAKERARVEAERAKREEAEARVWAKEQAEEARARAELEAERTKAEAKVAREQARLDAQRARIQSREAEARERHERRLARAKARQDWRARLRRRPSSSDEQESDSDGSSE